MIEIWQANDAENVHFGGNNHKKECPREGKTGNGPA